MKIIFSRKGADSAYWGTASPVLNFNGSMIPVFIPIPERFSSPEFWQSSEIDLNYGTKKKLSDFIGNIKVHFDPMIFEINGQVRGFLGQCHAAASHLSKNRIKEGDVFLFFGWYKSSDLKRLYPSGFHAIFGYLEVAEVIDLKSSEGLARAKLIFETFKKEHPHIVYARLGYRNCRKNNLLFVAKKSLSFIDGFSGAGYFKITKETILSEPGNKRSYWRIPGLFCPQNGIFSYNTDQRRWHCQNGIAYLHASPRGQEFVFTPKSEQIQKSLKNWLSYLIKNFALKKPIYSLKNKGS